MNFSEQLHEYGILGMFDTIVMMKGESCALAEKINFSYSTIKTDDGDDDDSDYLEKYSGISFYEIQQYSIQLASLLRYRFGSKKGDRILLICKGCCGAEVCSVLACLRAEVLFVPIAEEWMENSTRMKQIISVCNPIGALVVGNSDSDDMVKLLSRYGLFRCGLVEPNGSPVLKEFSPCDYPDDFDSASSFCGLENFRDALVHGYKDDAADDIYLLFTSGSSGVPKGVIGSQRGLISRITWQWNKFPFLPSNSLNSELVCRRTPLIFVDSMAEIFSALLAGIPIWSPSLELLRTEGLPGIVPLASQMEVTRITLLPSQLSQMLDLYKDSSFSTSWQSLLMIIVSGESCPPSLVKNFRNSKSKATLINLYGSTEVSGDVTFSVVSIGDNPADILEEYEIDCLPWLDSQMSSIGQCCLAKEDTASVPIGMAMDNNIVLLLRDTDSNNFDVIEEFDVKGELAVLGFHVTRGYFNRPDLANAKFLSCPNSVLNYLKKMNMIDSIECDAKNPLKVFLMGDIGVKIRQSNENFLDSPFFYLGRKDRQVKIRGIRIELEDVESTIYNIIQKEIFVHCFDNIHGNQVEPHLVLFLEKSALEELALSNSELISFLSLQMISAYVPSYVYVLQEAFPRTVSGKLNRQEVLKDYQNSCNGDHLARTTIPNLSDLSKDNVWSVIISILSDVIVTSHIGELSRDAICDSTFEQIGGNSMSVIEFSWKLHRFYGKSVGTAFSMDEIRTLTISEIVKCVENRLIGGNTEFSIIKRKMIHSDINPTSVDSNSSIPSSSKRLRGIVESNTPRISAVHDKRSVDLFEKECDVVYACDKEWLVNLGRCVDASPVIVEFENQTQCAIIGSHSGQVVSVSLQNDAKAKPDLLWTINLACHIEGDASVDMVSKLVFISGYKLNDVESVNASYDDAIESHFPENCHGGLFALNLHDGSVVWKTYFPGEVKSSGVLIFPNVVAVGTYDKHLYLVSSRDGTIITSVDLQGSVFSTPLLLTEDRSSSCSSSAQLVCPTNNGYIESFRVYSDCKIESLWIINLDSPLFASLASVSLNGIDHLLAAGVDGSLTLLSLDGTCIWKVFCSSRPIFSSPRIFVFNNCPYCIFGSHDTNLRVFRIDTGDIVAEIPMTSAIVSSPCILSISKSKVVAVVTSTSGMLSLISLENQDQCPIETHTLSNYQFDAEIFSSPLYYHGAIYVGCRDDCLHKISVTAKDC